jgi:hypothetical protein
MIAAEIQIRQFIVALQMFMPYPIADLDGDTSHHGYSMPTSAPVEARTTSGA